MSLLEQSAVRNRLLQRLSSDDFALLRPHLRSQVTELRQGLIQPHNPITDLFFPEAGYVSITTAGSGKVEVGIIGPEGVVGASPILLGSDRTPYEHLVQGAGEVIAIGVPELVAAAEASPTLRRLLLRFVQVLLIQTAQTAFANASYNIEVRLGRWLLMCQDRASGDELTVTHDFLSFMLGVQRTTVTLARKPFIVPIPGTRKLERVEENLGSAQVVLTAADMGEIEVAASAIPVQGERLPPAVLQFSYR